MRGWHGADGSTNGNGLIQSANASCIASFAAHASLLEHRQRAVGLKRTHAHMLYAVRWRARRHSRTVRQTVPEANRQHARPGNVRCTRRSASSTFVALHHCGHEPGARSRVQGLREGASGRPRARRESMARKPTPMCAGRATRTACAARDSASDGLERALRC